MYERVQKEEDIKIIAPPMSLLHSFFNKGIKTKSNSVVLSLSLLTSNGVERRLRLYSSSASSSPSTCSSIDVDDVDVRCHEESSLYGENKTISYCLQHGIR